MFQLFLFTKDENTIKKSMLGGISGFIVDWENKGKPQRQRGFNTQVNYDTVDDLKRVRALTDALVICRINRNIDLRSNNKEIDTAIDNGADEILMPMVRTVQEVEYVLDYVNGRCKVGILIETDDAVKLAEKFCKLPLSRVYVGLNDLIIDRGKTNIFEPLDDGTVDTVKHFIRAPFGFAGLTLPDLGYPIPCRLLISEMARLGCSFTFLRRSFLSDIKGKDMSVEIPRIYEAITAAFNNSDKEMAAKQAEVKKIIRETSYFFNRDKE